MASCDGETTLIFGDNAAAHARAASNRLKSLLLSPANLKCYQACTTTQVKRSCYFLTGLAAPWFSRFATYFAEPAYLLLGIFHIDAKAESTGSGRPRLRGNQMICPRPAKSASVLSHPKIRIDWSQTPQLQGASGENRVRSPIEPLRCRRWGVCGQPCWRGPRGCRLWRSSSMYVPIHNPPRFAPRTPWPSVNPKFWV